MHELSIISCLRCEILFLDITRHDAVLTNTQIIEMSFMSLFTIHMFAIPCLSCKMTRISCIAIISGQQWSSAVRHWYQLPGKENHSFAIIPNPEPSWAQRNGNKVGGWGRAALHRNRPLCQKPFWLASHHITLCNISQTLIEIFLQAVILLFKIFPGYQAFIFFAGYQERDLPDAAEGGG